MKIELKKRKFTYCLRTDLKLDIRIICTFITFAFSPPLVVIEKGLGHSVTVCIESSTSHKLQTTSLITISKTPEGKR